MGFYQKQKADTVVQVNNVKNILADIKHTVENKTTSNSLGSAGAAASSGSIVGASKSAAQLAFEAFDMTGNHDSFLKQIYLKSKEPVTDHATYTHLTDLVSTLKDLADRVDQDMHDESSASKSAARSKRICEYIHEDLAEDGSTVMPWHKLLTCPTKQMIVVDRMHSGNRRFVTLDFGQPVMLTDIVVPACEDLVLLAIDIWCFDEDSDSSRLLLTGDIGSKTIVLSDMQPPPICRFLKLTITGRYGISASRCKIPIGQFFGHVLVLDNDGYAHPIMNYIKTKPTNLPGQLKALRSLYEDVHCRYSLASSKLAELLDPLFNGDISNVAHMQAYLNQPRDGSSSSSSGSSPESSSSVSDVDHTRIVTMYEECISFQQQLNIIQNVIRRLDTAHRGSNAHLFSVPSPPTLQTISSDKLRVLSECLVDMLLNSLNEFGSQVRT